MCISRLILVLALVSQLIVFKGDVPQGWEETDIGTGQTPGQCTEVSGTWTITGSGDTDGTSDKFRFCYQTVSGDQQIIANITACTTSAAFGQECGVMVRGSLDVDAVHMSCMVNDSTAIVEYRTTIGGSTGSDDGPNITTGMTRLRIFDGVAICDVSDDGGDTWTEIGMGHDLGLSGNYELGMFTNTNLAILGPSRATMTVSAVNISVPIIDEDDFGGYRAHWQGFGYDTTGGQTGGTRVCVVNTLSLDGTNTWGSTGDYGDCVFGTPAGCEEPYDQADCARYVVFSVSGTIGSTSTDRSFAITAPYLTVAGQTAPMHSEGSDAGADSGPGGIQVVNVQHIIDAAHVVLQHLRIRYYEPDSGGECFVCIGIGGGDHSHIHHVVLDHVSTAWNRGNVGSSGLAFPQVFVSRYTGGDIQIVDSLIAEPIYDGGGGSLGMGVDIGIDSTTTIARNLFVSALWRNPTVALPGLSLLYNNVMYNTGDNGDCGDTSAQVLLFSDRSDDSGETGGGSAVYLNNAFIEGPSTGAQTYWICAVADAANLANGMWLHLSGNSGSGVTACDGEGNFDGMGTGSAFPPQTNAVTGGSGSNIREDDLLTGILSWVGAFDLDLILPTTDCTGVNTAVRSGVLNNAGARPNDGTEDRDDADARLVADVLDGSGGDADNDTTWATILGTHGGIPPIAERSRAWSAPANPNNAGSCGASRTIMECYLENDSAFGAQRVEVSQGVP